jgi:hypothetical protein
MPTIPRNARIALSVLAVFQILSVAAEPLRFFTQSPVKFAAEDARWLRWLTGAYVDFMYLSHGYSFFAPNPGPSHLLECEIIPRGPTADGRAVHSTGRPVVAKDGQAMQGTSSWRVFPDRRNDRPRLLYHRYFMLSEFYQTQFAPASLADAAQLEANVLERWKEDRRRYTQLQDSIRENLSMKYPDHTIIMRRIEHGLPSEYQILVDGWKLTDLRLYVELAEGEPPTGIQEKLPPP